MQSRIPLGSLLVVLLVTLAALYASAPTFKMPGLFGWTMGEKAYREYEKSEITYGLDLQGGMDLVYEVDTDVAAEVQTASEIVRNRIDLYGVANPIVQVQSGSQIRVQVPGQSGDKFQKIKQIIDLTDLLTLHAVVQETTNVLALAPGPDEIVYEKSVPQPKKGQSPETPSWFLLKKVPEFTGDGIKKAFPGFDQTGQPKIQLEVVSDKIKEFEEVSARNLHKRLAIVLGKKVFMAPTMQAVIKDGRCEITGSFDIDEARRIISILKAGALPASMKKLSENTVGPTLGAESVRRGTNAAKWGFAIVLVYMIAWYKLAGVFAVFALILNLLLLVAGLRFFDAALTLPGIAGVILTIGMAVDANVIIFERIKEERANGKSIRGAIAGGFDKALSAVLDSNITTLITAVVLYLLGSGPVKGFAVTLALGIICSLFTALFCVRTFLDATYAGKKIGTISI